MTSRLAARTAPILLLLAPLLAILAARLATHSDIAARHPRTAAPAAGVADSSGLFAYPATLLAMNCP